MKRNYRKNSNKRHGRLFYPGAHVIFRKLRNMIILACRFIEQTSYFRVNFFSNITKKLLNNTKYHKYHLITFKRPTNTFKLLQIFRISIPHCMGGVYLIRKLIQVLQFLSGRLLDVGV